MKMEHEVNNQTAGEHGDGGAKQGPEQVGQVTVTIEHVNSLQEVKLHARWTDTIQQLWDEAYRDLNEPHRQDDRLQTEDGVDLMPFLSLSLRQLHDDKQIKTHKFQIVGPTGGAGQ